MEKAGVEALPGLLQAVPFRRSDRHPVTAPLYHATGSGFGMIGVTDAIWGARFVAFVSRVGD